MPTLNPPGQDYLQISKYLDKRLSAHRFETQMICAHGTPGDSGKYPRWNTIARRKGKHAGDCVHFNSHTDVVEVGAGWTFDPFGGQISDGKI